MVEPGKLEENFLVFLDYRKLFSLLLFRLCFKIKFVVRSLFLKPKRLTSPAHFLTAWSINCAFSDKVKLRHWEQLPKFFFASLPKIAFC
jgi:hypothetical protein